MGRITCKSCLFKVSCSYEGRKCYNYINGSPLYETVSMLEVYKEYNPGKPLSKLELDNPWNDAMAKEVKRRKERVEAMFRDNKYIAEKDLFYGKYFEAFLEGIAEYGTTKEAVGYMNVKHKVKYKPATVNMYLGEADEDQIEQINAHKEVFNDLLEAEAIRRGITGVDEDVWYKGEIVGAKKKYSDTILHSVLKANKPEKYNESKNKPTQTNNVNIRIARFTNPTPVLKKQEEVIEIESDTTNPALQLAPKRLSDSIMEHVSSSEGD